MAKPLRVLLIEDSEPDAELVLRALRRGGYEPSARRVDTAKGVEDALEAEWDVVISDYAMPGFSGLDALKRVRARGLDVPFLIVSGTIGEDTAVAAMKAGAHDYIMKDKLARLVPAIERELEEAVGRRARRQVESALKREQAYNEAILSSMADALFVIASAGGIHTCNERALGMLGWTRDELIGRSIGKILAASEEQPRADLDRIRRNLRRGEIRDVDALFKRRDGNTLPVSLSCALLPKKDGSEQEIVLVARDITDRQRLREERRQYTEQLEEEAQRAHDYAETVLRMSDPASQLVGRSAPYKRIVKFVKDVADAPSPVLILGESGTGKEMVARAIRLNGGRSEKPFVVVDCAALGASLLESELFGHERGAFTGAHESRAGLIEIADGGTLFVDEIGEMPLALQSKLLRALERGEFRRVGSAKERVADIRVIAATNRDLAAEVRKKLFRSDLYFRLNVLAITLPPLRERQEDIPLLARHFLEHNRVTMPGGKELRPDALEHLKRYDWPGNVRELANLIERAIILSGKTRVITPAHFPPEVKRAAAKAAPRGPARKLADTERESVETALAATNGNKTKAAEMLGITRVTLRNKIRKYGIKPPA